MYLVLQVVKLQCICAVFRLSIYTPNDIVASIEFLLYGTHPNLRTDNDSKADNMWHIRDGNL